MGGCPEKYGGVNTPPMGGVNNSLESGTAVFQLALEDCHNQIVVCSEQNGPTRGVVFPRYTGQCWHKSLTLSGFTLWTLFTRYILE